MATAASSSSAARKGSAASSRRSYADEGRDVIVTGRDQSRAETAAQRDRRRTRGIGFDLAEPHTIAGALADVGDVDHLVLVAIERDVNKVREYDIDAALRLVTLKLVGYTEVIHVARAAAARRLQHPLLRRPRARSALPGLDHRDDRQRRGDRASCGRSCRARADPRQRDPPGDRRRQPAVARHGPGAAQGARRPDADRPARDDGGGRRPPRASCSRTRRSTGINLVVDGGWMCM